jgi:hypothetical protein
VTDQRWRERSACADDLPVPVAPGVTLHVKLDPNIWFPRRGEPAFLAKRICAACPVRQSCLSYALAEHEETGVWGGAGESIRRRLNWLATNGRWQEFTDARATHFARLDELAATGRQSSGTQPSFGPGAAHGRASTAARGCRCTRCRFASVVRTTRSRRIA